MQKIRLRNVVIIVTLFMSGVLTGILMMTKFIYDFYGLRLWLWW